MHCDCPMRSDMRGPYFFANCANFWCGEAPNKCSEPMTGSPVGPGGRLAGLLSTTLRRRMTSTVAATTYTSSQDVSMRCSDQPQPGFYKPKLQVGMKFRKNIL